jgi:DNA polymerase-3 subunit beta
MKLTILQESLSKGLSVANKFVSSKVQLPVLANILFRAEEGKLKLSATNLETGINLWLPAKVEEKGEITISAKSITEFISSLPAEAVQLKVEKNKLEIVCRNYRASFNGIAASEFPQVPSLRAKKTDSKLETINLHAKDLVEAINKVAFTAAQDESRPVLTGVRLTFLNKEIQLVATDGYRLSLKTVPLKNEVKMSSLIIPARAMMELARICLQEEKQEKLEVNLTKEGNQLIFSFNDVEIVTRLIEGEFPDFMRIIPQEKTTQIIVNAEEFQRSIKVASLFAKDSANIVRFSIEKQKLKITANAPDVGENEIELEVKQEGDDNKIAFNCRFLQEFLSIFNKEEVVMESSGALKPGVFKQVKDGSFLHIIMPVRIQE